MKGTSIAAVVAANRHFHQYGYRYAQSAQQLAQGGELGRRITGDSLDFKPAAERYPCNEAGQYDFDLPASKRKT